MGKKEEKNFSKNPEQHTAISEGINTLYIRVQ
jgi:hypothetical protein